MEKITTAPILIHQMGKVGSTSIADALTTLHIPVVHTHLLHQTDLATVEDRFEKRQLPVPKHVARSRRVWADIMEKNKSLRIITGVRDPIARNISAYFQNLLWFRNQKDQFDEDELESMTQEFIHDFHNHDEPFIWFDRQIKEVFDIDVYEYDFPQTLGYQIIRKNEIRLLILRAETPDKTKVAALQEFLNISEFPLVSKNVAAQKSYKDYYSAFTQRICLPEEYIDRMYNSQYAKHFYTLEEINRFRERWVRRRGDEQKPQEREAVMRLRGRVFKAYPTNPLGETPILVHQMGKVGSSSVVEALTNKGLPVVQLHALNTKSLAVIQAQYEQRGLSLPAHIHDSQRVWAELIDRGKPVQVITAVRDPIARNISAFFQNLDIFREQKKVLKGKSDAAEIEKMIDDFLKKYDHNLPLRWFDTEIRDVFGLDVFAYPFPKALGTQIIQEDGIRLLILRAETSDTAKVTAIREFLGIPDLHLPQKNRTAEKRLRNYYAAFLEQIHLPDDFIEYMYTSQYAQHFYTPEEIQTFRQQWTRHDTNQAEACEKSLNGAKSPTSRSVSQKHTTVSIVTPSFNQAPFLTECLESVRCQSYVPIEHLVYDPGSQDGSQEIARRYPHVTLIAEPDKGQGDAVAKGLRTARGDIIGWLNSDDCYMDEGVLAAVVDRFNQPDAPDIVYGCGTYVDEHGNYLRDAYINKDPATLQWRLHQEVGILQPALFFHRRVIEKIGVVSDHLHFCMDYEYWIRAMQAGLKFAFLPKMLARARYYQANKTYGDRGKSLSEICNMVKEQFGYVPRQWIQRYAEFRVEGFDGILVSPANTSIRSQAALDQEVHRLLTAYNTDYDTLALLHQKEVPPARETLKAMQKFALPLERPCKPIPLEQTTVPHCVCYTVGERRWAFDRKWKEQQIEKTRRAFERFRNERKSDICVIVGNGPSLNETDLSLLDGQDVFVANYAFLNEELFRHAKYLTVTNYLVAEQGAHQFNQLQGVRKLFPYWLGYCLQEGDETCFFNSIGRPEFSTDIHENVSWRSTVSYFQMQIAYWLGYRRVLLIGFDHNYQQDTGAREGDILLSKEDDTNHFDRTYFKGKRWQAADVDNMEAMYVLAKAAFEEDGREIVNCTVSGKLEIFRRGDLYRELIQQTPHSQTPHSSVLPRVSVSTGTQHAYPRVLLLDTTCMGGSSATGQLKQALFSGWPPEQLLQVYAAGPDRRMFGVYRQTPKGPSYEKTQDSAVVMSVCEVFTPDVIYYRPVELHPYLQNFAHQAVNRLQVPLVTHLMDDWPERLRQDDPARHASIIPQLQKILERSTTCLSICGAMSAAFTERYRVEFTAIANCIQPEDWLALEGQRKHRRSSEEPLIIRYAGALADDMNFQSVCDVARVIETLRNDLDVRLEIYTMPLWKDKALGALGDLRSVSVYDAIMEQDRYRKLLVGCDVLLIAYNFDEDSIRYVRYSMANKLPECLASAVPVLAYGPMAVATIAYAAETQAVQVVADRDETQLRAAIQHLALNPEYSQDLGKRAQSYAFTHHSSAKIREQFHSLLRQAATSHGWSETCAPRGANDPGLVGCFTREEHQRIDETQLVDSLLSERSAGSFMIDVGAHHGGSLKPFIQRGWRVLAFEPDPTNRKKLLQQINQINGTPLVDVDPRAVSDRSGDTVAFYASKESSGISSLQPFTDGHEPVCNVTTTTLTEVCEQHGISHVDFLKIDAEGYDLPILKGVPWERMRPDVIECEFEDRKTIPLGYDFHQLAQFLVDKGYTVLVSEWHPIVRYGIQHDWRRFIPYPCHLAGPDSWGNLIAFHQAPNLKAVASVTRRVLKSSPVQAKKIPQSGEVNSRHTAKAKGVSVPAAQGNTPMQAPHVQSEYTTPAQRTQGLLGRVGWFYSRWPSIVAAFAIVLNTAAMTDIPFNWAFMGAGTAVLLFLVGHAATSYKQTASDALSAGLRASRTADSARTIGGKAAVAARVARRMANAAADRSEQAAATAGKATASANLAQQEASKANERVEAALDEVRKVARMSTVAQETMDKATGTADTALYDANRAVELVESVLATVQTVSAESSSAMETATKATETADTALTEARMIAERTETAVETATKASGTADAALTEARMIAERTETAVETATKAIRVAERALTEAQKTLQRTQAVVETATKATETAGVALTAARTASETAGTALATADSASGAAGKTLNEVKTATETAETALTAARTASETAEMALDNATKAKKNADSTLHVYNQFVQKSNTLNAALFQVFPRQLSTQDVDRLLEFWVPALDLKLDRKALGYLAHRICLAEDTCSGRLATTVQDALLRVLFALSVPGAALSLIEIGTLFGINLAILYEACRGRFSNVHLTAIDPLGGYYNKGMADMITQVPVNRTVFEHNMRRMDVPAEALTLIPEFSTDKAALEAASERKYHLLIIDGDHSYQGVKFDFDHYSPFVESGGYIIFDDYNSTDWPDVGAFVDQEIRSRSGLKYVGADWRTVAFQVVRGVPGAS